MDNIRKRIRRRIKHANNRASIIKKNHGDYPGLTHTYHGGWDAGYWEGMATAYQNTLDLLEDNKDGEKISN